MARRTRARSPKTVDTIQHTDASRKNIPTAEYQAVMADDERSPIQVAYKRRNRDLDPQLVWRGKDEQDWPDLVVQAPPLYIQEKVHPKVLIDDLIRQSGEDAASESGFQTDLFADFNGLLSEDAKTEFYQHDANWSNRMILGDSLQVMASLAEREGLRGKVQCIYIDPPYGIKFNSNFQWSTTSRDVRDGKADHITREPEQVKAYRDTWRDGIHSYLTYLRDRLTVARDLLTESGSVFVQIGDENVHRIRALMDEVFGEENFVSSIWFKKNAFDASAILSNVFDHILWYSKSRDIKIRRVYGKRTFENSDSRFFDSIQLPDGTRRQLTKDEKERAVQLPDGSAVFARNPLTSAGLSSTSSGSFHFQGTDIPCASNSHWKTTPEGMTRLAKADRFAMKGTRLRMVRFISDNSIIPMANLWQDTGVGGFVGDDKVYVVQTDSRAIARCILMTTDPGDLVLDPTCGSGTTAYVAEQWGRRWITIDTSRVALALARARIMGARYPYYFLSDSRDGQLKEAEITHKAPAETSTYGDIRQGFVYERVPHITLRAIANNAEIDVIWEEFQEKLEPLRDKLNSVLGTAWEEWEIPREAEEDWPKEVKKLHADWWKQRIARQKEIDTSIAAKADYEYLYDKPYEDRNKVRVAGPFTVDSLSPHRLLGVDENEELIDNVAESKLGYGDKFDSSPNQDFATMILEHLKTSGVQQAHKEDKIMFSGIRPWPGDLVCAEGSYFEGDEDSGIQKRAGIFIGPEFGTVARPDLVQAAREAGEADFDVLIACAFNYEAHASEFNKLGRIPVLKARMNADLHMADDLKNTGKGNLFVIFGEPDIDILDADDDQIKVKINGVDVFHPNTGEIRSDDAGDIACWFVDTDYNEESFFARHAYFLGANDPYKSLKTTLKSEINQEAWATLKSDTSRPFDKPESGRIAVKVINHLGDEVMKVFRV
ncbi:MAG: DNA methyltransferase [Gemmatimonadota bacterium]|nr:DNA methyltransferase [Gemmatimonadota bacterium]